MGGFIVTAIFGEAFAASVMGSILAFAINMVASSIISKVMAPDAADQQSNQQPNPGNRQQLPPAGDNKLPVLYGTGYVGGIITDMSIFQDNQVIYWVMALCEVTNTDANSTGSPDTLTFGNIYWGGKKCIFANNAPISASKLVVGTQYQIVTVGTTNFTTLGAASNTVGTIFTATAAGSGTGTAKLTNETAVVGLLDESTGQTQDITGYLNIYLYNNGSNSPVNSALSAITVMQNTNLVYKWTGTESMSNCAFAIIRLKYSQSRNLVSLQQTKFQLTNSRKKPGDCFYDYLVSNRYGAAIDPVNIDTTSLAELNTYADESIGYYSSGGSVLTLKRYEFNGTIDTNLKIMQNLQSMADCCDCLLKYNEIEAKWGLIVNRPQYTVSMALNDSNITSAISVTPLDISSSFNVIEVKFPDGNQQDSFASASFSLETLNPALLYPNEPVNKQSVNLYLVNNSVTAQYIANRMLEAGREDLQVQFDIDYTGLQLEAGDIVTVTNANYGWTAKLFRINKVIQKFSDNGQVFATLMLAEFNPTVYDDKMVTEFAPAPNTGIGSPTGFGFIYAPIISGEQPSQVNPSFVVNVRTSSQGIVQYAEIYYSAFQYPQESQLIFAGTTEIQASGDPYNPSSLMPPVTLFTIPAGRWYFFTRMVNSLAKSDFSLASSLVNWKPTTFQFVEKYLSIAYADSVTGTGFSFNPRNKSYYGLYNTSSNTTSSNPANYQWYLADPLFGSNIYLVYSNRTGRKFSFDTDFANYAAGSGVFVPSTTNKFDIRLWSALVDGTNIIDLDVGTGQVIITGSTSSSVADGQIYVQNTIDGRLIASLDTFLPQIPPGEYLTGSAATITVDRYGRVVGFTPPDDFYISIQFFTATAGQTVFTPTARASGYITGQDLIFKSGALLDPSEYTETATTFTLATGAALNETVACVSMRAVSNSDFYESLNITVASTSTNTMVWDSATAPYQLINVGDKITFSNLGTPTQYTVTAVNYNTRTITFSTNPTATAGATIYRFRASGSSYPAFSRWSATLTNTTTYTPTTWAIISGFELPFINGTIVNEQDYDIVSGAITNFPSSTSGTLNMIQFAKNNLSQPVGLPSNVVSYTVAGQILYSFNYDPLSFNLYANGVLLRQVSDYTTATGNYSFTITPDNSVTILVQQTFARLGAA